MLQKKAQEECSGLGEELVTGDDADEIADAFALWEYDEVRCMCVHVAMKWEYVVSYGDSEQC